jgi:hypothetical protein
MFGAARPAVPPPEILKAKNYPHTIEEGERSMRSIRVLAATALFAITAVPMFGSCTFPLTTKDLDLSNGIFQLSWTSVFGAKQYEVQTSLDNFVHTTSLGVVPSGTTAVTLQQRSSRLLSGYSYRVIASDPGNPQDLQCSGTTTYLAQSVPLVRTAHKTIIPVVGSTRGVNNAQFKTSLRLGPAGTFHTTGKIVFHPAGQPGSDNDPSIPYVIDGGQILEFDDVVAAMGQSGIGSLDIVPSGYLDPNLDFLPIEVRLFNQAPEGTYGAFESHVEPADAFRPADWTLRVPSSRFRVNIGVRTITATHASFLLISATTGVYTQKSMDLPADYMFMDAADHFFGVPVGQGDSITIHFDDNQITSGSILTSIATIAIPFHTFTDNSTNDPAIFSIQSPTRVVYPEIESVKLLF